MGIVELEDYCRCARGVLLDTLALLWKTKRIDREGSGKAGSPFMFSLPVPRAARRSRPTLPPPAPPVTLVDVVAKLDELIKVIYLLAGQLLQPQPQPQYYPPQQQYVRPAQQFAAPPAPPPPTVLSPPQQQMSSMPVLRTADGRPMSCQWCGNPAVANVGGRIVCMGHAGWQTQEAQEENSARRLLPGLR